MKAIAIGFPRPVRYAASVRLQEALLLARIENAIPDVLLVLQHFPVVTLGRRAREEHLHVSPQALAARGIDFAVASRGGDVTYHGPGQLVLYPILRLDPRISGAHGYLWQLEEIALRTAEAFQVSAYRRPGKSGAWTTAGKIAAIGFRLRRWVASHGMSLNVDDDLSGFDLMSPCGLAGEPVASFQTHLGDRTPSHGEVTKGLLHATSVVLGLEIEFHSSDSFQGPEPVAALLQDQTDLYA